jgi:ribosome maturation factor RimP
MRTRKSSRAAAAARPLADRAANNRSAGPPRVTRWTLAPEIEAEIADIATAAGCELLHAEWKGGVLRLVLDRRAATESPAESPAENMPESSDGVTLADCELVAKHASALLDVLDFGNGRYLLEVSSPGLDRQLYRPSDYQRFLGRLARVTFEASDPAEPGVARRRTIVARLAEFHAPPDGGAAEPLGPLGTLALVDERTGERLELKLEEIRLARLEIEL